MSLAGNTGVRARKAAELGLAVPWVMGHRLLRLAAAGPLPSARDQQEFQLMGTEKIVAFTEAWVGMSVAMWQANLVLGTSMLGMMGTPWLGGSALQPGRQWQSAMIEALDKGLAPIHRTATANARRLARVGPPRR
ncbi:MAG: hypothetical protein M9951_18265 [Burkholderiaceae bacterium]|nr:hypothetical protein [Burkholderiaceae bacterium]